jgi:hypothetical protein
MTTTKARIILVDFEGPETVADTVVRAIAAQMGERLGDGRLPVEGGLPLQMPPQLLAPPTSQPPNLSAPAPAANGTPARARATPPPPAKINYSVADIDAAAFNVGVFLKTNGRSRRDAIMRGCKLDFDCIEQVLQRPWFEKDGGGHCWTLSSAGHAHFRREDD